MGLMALNLATLNVRGMRDPGKCTRLLGELKTLGVDVAAVQETHFTCGADCRVLESDFHVFSAVPALGFLSWLDAALMLMLTLFLQVKGAN